MLLFVRVTVYCSLLTVFAYAQAVSAALNTASAPVPTAIPDALKPWVTWVLKDQAEYGCPRIAQQTEQRRCAWPGLLSVDVTANAARFTQNWQVFGNSWIILPGNTQHWPGKVLLNGKPATVLDRNGRPAIQLEPGEYTVEGSLNWLKPPQYLPIATDTALIQLRRDGQIATAQLDNNGRLWLRDQPGAKPNEERNDTLKVEVFRLLSDDIPLQLNTELRLAVAGKPREILLGQLLPDNAEVMAFNSSLPARVEADGRLRVQARAGEWRISLQARYLAPVTLFNMKKLDPLWPEQEIWSFRANPQLRGVKISGVPAVDPSQIDIPPQFANLPTYLMTTDQTLSLDEQYRGDAAPAANRLNLRRTLWLDFDGGGATTKDHIQGTFTHNWRLRSAPDLSLGRIVVNGTPQLVTRMPGEQNDGIEIRHSQVDVEAISRLPSLAAVSATGWLHDFDSVDLQLRLPPGWQLWHATGPDRVQLSWLSHWDLWDLFICLLIVGGLFRVLDWRWGCLGALTLALTYHQPGSPLLGWVILIAALPLLAALSAGRFKQLINGIAHATLTVLVVTVIAFAVQQIRQGIYPQLEQQRAINSDPYGYASSTLPAASPELAMEADMLSSDSLARKSTGMRGMTDPAPLIAELKQQRYRPTDNVQTGPGEPSWQWHQVSLGWSGPVKAAAPLSLYLSPPWLTRTLKFIQVALVCLLLYGLGSRLIKYHWLLADRERKTNDQSASTSAASSPLALLPLLPLLIMLATQLAAPGATAATYPSRALLEELKTTLTRAPDCSPQCAAVQQTHLALTDQGLVLSQRVSVGVAVAFPLPADKSWQPTSVVVDNQPASLASADNKLWVHLMPGSHDITLTGAIRGDNISVPFPLTPHTTTVIAEGWRIHGLSEGQVAGGTIQLEKEVRETAQDTLLPAPVKPFVRVERQLSSDLDWEVTTTVSRIAPATGSINLRIPLLAGEAVVTQNLLTENQHVLVTLGAEQRQTQWRSVIKPVAQLSLQAPSTTAWIEHWQILASPRWHISGDGIPLVKTGSDNGPHVQLWQPWPGETLTLTAVQPQPVPGPTTTVENVEINHHPGGRSATLTLSLRIRTSLGGDYKFAQPPSARLQSITIDGVEQTTPGEDQQVVIPLHPGLQTVAIIWELDQGVVLTTATPRFELPTPASNIDIKLQLPSDRWPLLVNGPDIGPAMLYWGVLAVILIIAAGLGKIIKLRSLSVPVNTWQWLLLALGMSTVNMVGSIPVVLWFFAMEARRRRPLPTSSSFFNIAQMGLIALSVIALLSLFYTIPQSLLSAPNMQVTGNGSSNYFYQWYQDHSLAVLPQGWVFSLPLWVFRIAMLLWSLWIVFALLGWIRWGWQCLSTGGLWNNTPTPRARTRFGKKPVAADNTTTGGT